MNRPLALPLVVGLPLAVFGACSSEDPPVQATPTPTNTVTGTVDGSGTMGTTDAGAQSMGAGPVTATNGAPTTVTTGDVTTTSTTGATATTAPGTSSSTGGATSSSTTDGVDMNTTDAGTSMGGATSTSTMDNTVTTGEPMGPTLEELVGSLDGRLVMTPCGDTPNTDDCNGGGWITDGQLTACEGGQLNAEIDHPIGGTPGATYELTIHFYGIAEPKVYGNTAVREAGGDRPNLDGNTPTPWATAPANHTYPPSNYNTYEIRVENENGQETAVYYLNADTQEGHYTMIINYEKTIPVIGGGNVHLRIYDANCRQIKNCGTQAGFPCSNKARTVDISAADPQPQMGNPPNGFSQPGLGQTADHSGQWLLIDVVGFTEG